MNQEISVGLSVFVEHGRQQEAADFYAAAFGAQQLRTHGHAGTLMAVDMQLGALTVSVVGANPKREANPSQGGPFFPKAPGAVSTALRLTVPDLDAVVARAVSAGAMIRNAPGPNDAGRRSAAIYDPFGHLWGLTEREASADLQAA